MINQLRRLGIATSAFVVAGSLVVGCGSSGSKSSDAAATQKTSTTTVGGTPTSEQGTSTPITHGSGGKFCAQLSMVAANEAEAGPGAQAAPDDMKKAVEQYKSYKDALQKSAPAELQPDITTLFAYLDKIYDALGKAGYDWKNVSPETLAGLAGNLEQVQIASQHLTTYIRDKCGFGGSPSS